MTDIVYTPTGDDSSVRAMVAEVINATWTKGIEIKNEFSAKMTEAQDNFLSGTSTPTVAAGTVDVPSVAAPGVSIPATADTTSVLSMFDTKYLELVGMLVEKFEVFKAEYFPDESSAYTAAEDWLQAAVANPDSALPPAVQAKIWGDDQARILADTTRAGDAALAQFAGRRFPMPPGAAASAVMQIQQKAQDELAESSRKIAILSVEMQKFSVEKLLNLRQIAMDACIKYISALASGPDMASKVIGIGYDAQSKLIAAAADFYRAEVQAAELTSKVNQFNSSMQLEAASKNQAAELTMIEDKLKALLAEAQLLSQSVTSLFNNVHASVGASASRNAQVGYNYSNDTAGPGPTLIDVG